MPTLRVLIVIPALGPVYGGPSKIAVELAQALGKLGVSVDVVATNANGAQTLAVPLHTWVLEDGYRLRYFPYGGPGETKLSWTLTQWLWYHVTDYDLVHTIAVFSYSVAAAHLICQIRRVPYVMNPQGMLEPWALSYKSWKKNLYYQFVEKNALQQANAIQALNKSEAEHLHVLGQDFYQNLPLVIVPNGLHWREFERSQSPDLFYSQFPETVGQKIVLFLGRLDPKKGLDLLAPAFRDLRTQFSQAHLVVAGPDNSGFLPTIKQFFADADCLDNVTFTGLVTGSLKAATLAAAGVYVAPSYSEGFSLSILEGMATGLPCVMTVGCNFPEAGMLDAAHVVEANSRAIAAALIHCFANPDAAKEMGDRARQLIKNHYTWDRVATQLIAIYQAILEHKPLPYSL